jgi:Protein of unknown function (DUF3168)
MTTATWHLQTAIYSALSADATLTGLLGGTKVFDDVPRGTEFPYVTIGQSRVRDWSTGTDRGDEHIVTLHVWSRDNGRKSVEAIIDAIAAGLHDQPLAVTGHRLINLRRELSDIRRESDGETYHGIVRFRAVTEAVS